MYYANSRVPRILVRGDLLQKVCLSLRGFGGQNPPKLKKIKRNFENFTLNSEIISEIKEKGV